MAISNFLIGDTSAAISSEISEYVTSIDVSWTLDAVSQLTVKIYDRDMKMFLNNYFQIRREVFYGSDNFEISAVNVGKSSAAGAEVTLECRRREIQAMRRDKNPRSIGGVTARDYAQLAAEKFGLGFVGENTSVQRTISKASNSSEDPSVWDVLTSLASSAQFSIFESDKTLYFASQEWLLNKWANVTFTYPTDDASPFQILEIPTCRKSDDDPNEAEFQAVLRRGATALSLRPGMTVTLSGMGEFSIPYLISEVQYAIEAPDPIGVSAKTPVKKKPKGK